MENPKRSRRQLNPDHKTKMIKGRALAQKKRQNLSSVRSKAAKASHKARAIKAKENKKTDESLPEPVNRIDLATAEYLARGNANIINSMDAFYTEVNYDAFNEMCKTSLEEAGVDVDAETAKMAEIEAKIAREPPQPIIGFMSPSPQTTAYTIPPGNTMYPSVNDAPKVMVMSTSTTAYGIPTNAGPSTSFLIKENYEAAQHIARNQTDDDSDQYSDKTWTIERLKEELRHKNKALQAFKNNKKAEANKRPPKTIANFKTKSLQITRLQELYDSNGITSREAFALVPASLTPEEDANIMFKLGISEPRRAYLKQQLGELGLDILAPTKEFHKAFANLCFISGYSPLVEEDDEFLNGNIEGDPILPPVKPRKRASRAEKSIQNNDYEELE